MDLDIRSAMTDYLDDFVFDIVRNDDVFQESLSHILYVMLLESSGEELSPLTKERYVSNKKDLKDHVATMFTRYVEGIRSSYDWGVPC